MGQNNIIELNGRRYDAITGVMLSGSSQNKVQPQGNRSSTPQRHGRTVDGFARHYPTKDILVKPITAKSHNTLQKSVSSPAAIVSDASVKRVHDIKKPGVTRTVAKTISPRQPQRPKTLMRRAVNKPKVELKPQIKANIPTEMMARPASSIAKPLEKKNSVTKSTQSV